MKVQILVLAKSLQTNNLTALRRALRVAYEEGMEDAEQAEKLTRAVSERPFLKQDSLESHLTQCDRKYRRPDEVS